jgi:hypothetical protein
MTTKPKPRKADLPVFLDCLLTLAEVGVATSLSGTELRAMRARGDFPPPDSPDGERPIKYRTSTVQRWIEQRYNRNGQRLPAQEKRRND